MDKLKIGIAGCGKISHFHRVFIDSYPNATLCAVADKDEHALREMSEQYGIRNCYTNIEEMIEQESTDVVHIATPPQTHAALAAAAIERNNHVFIEKPIALDHTVAVKLYDMASRNNVRICVDHNHLFDPWMLEAKDVLKDLRSNITYVESYCGINPDIPEIIGYRETNEISSIFSLPGGIFHKFLIDPLYLMLDYTGKPLQIEVMARSCGALFQDLSDELHIMVYGEQAIGKLTISFNARPFQQFVKVYHKKATVTIDFINMTTVGIRHAGPHGVATKVATNLGCVKALTARIISNGCRFTNGELKPYLGMRNLIHGFYDSIRHGLEPPISRESTLNVLEVMDGVWHKAGKLRPVFNHVIMGKVSSWARHKERVLVTGAQGFLGRRLTEMLLEKGYSVRILVPKLIDIEPFRELGVDIHYSDARSEMALAQAIESMDYVVHAAVAQGGEWEDLQTFTQGTEKIMLFSHQLKVKRVIYISSTSVYQMNGLKQGSLVREDTMLEQSPAARGLYTYVMLETENMIRSLMGANGNGKVPAVIIRPAIIYGPRGTVFNSLVGISVLDKLFVIPGKKKTRLPLVYVDNLVDAIIKCIEDDRATGQIFNVVDDDWTTKQGYLKKLVKELSPSSYAVTLPHWLVKSAVHLQEIAFRIMKRNPIVTRDLLDFVSGEVNFSNEKIKNWINWSPRLSTNEGFERTRQWFKENGKSIRSKGE